MIIIAGHIQDHAYVSSAAFSSFLVTFQVSVSSVNEGAFNGPNASGARTFAIDICMARVLATMYGIFIAMGVIVFVYPQTAAKDFYRAVKAALGQCSSLLALEARRMRKFDPEESAAQEDDASQVRIMASDSEEDFGHDEGLDLFESISRVADHGLLAAAEFSWLSPPFPAIFPVDLTRVFRDIQVGIARLRQTRLRIAVADRLVLARTETFRHGNRILGKHVPALLNLLASFAEKACSGYQGKVRIEIDDSETLDVLMKDVQNTFDSTFEEAYRLESQSLKLTNRQKSSMFRFVHAMRHLHHGALEMTRTLCVLQVIRTVNTRSARSERVRKEKSL
jgi:hypothetical protein